jgi:hypothetical protein
LSLTYWFQVQPKILPQCQASPPFGADLTNKDEKKKKEKKKNSQDKSMVRVITSSLPIIIILPEYPHKTQHKGDN